MGKFIDLTGKHINEWHVDGYLGSGYWQCTCSCGVIKKVNGADLRNNKSASCGHTRLNSLKGKQFGEWEVLEYAGEYKWKCRCSCGVERIVDSYSLTSGHSKSCGHDKLTDLTGKTINEWHVIKYLGKKMYLCQCSCGEIREVSGKDLRNNHSKSCGHGNSGKYLINTNNEIIDLTGDTIGQWKVIDYAGKGRWNCICECGNKATVLGTSLRFGKSKSCGHNSGKLEDLTGKTFGELYVERYIGDTYWECTCSCSKKINVKGRYLRDGAKRDCGHTYKSKLVDLTGRIFGELEVIEYIDNGKWICRCNCGNIIEVLGCNLKNGNTRSCGCKTRELRENSLYTSGNAGNRTIEQLRATRSKQELLAFIGKIPVTLIELADKLGIVYGSAVRLCKVLNLYDIVTADREGSSLEDEIYTYIKSIYDGDIIRHDRDTLNGKEIDFYIPEKNLAIEFNGTYWHCDYNKDKRYHQHKTIECFKKSLYPIHIFEYEWRDGNKQALIKNFIKDLLCDGTIIYARNTEIVEIDYDEARIFENEYHLQGCAKSSINIALKYNGGIIAVMTFGKPRFNNNFQYELIRLCYKTGYKVVGGSEKLFKYFVNKYKPLSIVSYCDISKFNGSVYFKLGFKTDVSKLTEPNYVWVEPNRKYVLTRYQTQKHKLIKNGIGTSEDTEDSIMKNQGFLKIYDSGNMRFEWLGEQVCICMC